MEYKIFNAIFGLFWPPLALFFSRVARYAPSSQVQIRLKRASNLVLINF